jgi:hypothetical protein
MFRQLKKLHVFGSRDVPEKFSGAGLAADSFDQSGAAHTKIFDFDRRILVLESLDDPRNDGAAREGAVPDNLRFLLGGIDIRCRGLCACDSRHSKRNRQATQKYARREKFHATLLLPMHSLHSFTAQGICDGG